MSARRSFALREGRMLGLLEAADFCERAGSSLAEDLRRLAGRATRPVELPDGVTSIEDAPSLRAKIA